MTFCLQQRNSHFKQLAVKWWVVHKSYYYTKHNGFGYILYSDFESSDITKKVGDYIEDIYINPSNPIDFRTKGELGVGIFYLIFVISFSLPWIIIIFFSIFSWSL